MGGLRRRGDVRCIVMCSFLLLGNRGVGIVFIRLNFGGSFI